MRVVYRHILLLFFLLPACQKGFSQPGQLQFTHLDANDGLSHNQVNCILKDNEGFLWFGTMSGLNRYDGYSFKIFRHDTKDSTSLSDNYIEGIFQLPDNKLWINTRNGSDIYDPATEAFDRNEDAYLRSLHLPPGTVHAVIEDQHGDYWFIYAGIGLNRYDAHTEKIVHIGGKTAHSLSDNHITGAGFDSSGHLWVIHNNGIIEELDARDRRIMYRTDTLFKLVKVDSLGYNIFIDRQNDLWIYAPGTTSGLYYFSSVSHQLIHFAKDAGKISLNNNVVYGVVQDKKGIIWVGTDHGGINLINKKDFSVRYLMHNPEDPNSLSQNSVYALYKDNSGIIWVGTYKKGISYYNEIFDRFPLYSHDPGNIRSLPYEDVNRFVEDKDGNLWIGTNGGGLIYFDRKNNTYKQYLHEKSNSNSLCNNVVVGLYLDDENKLRIGTYLGGLDCFDGKTFTHYYHIEGDTSSLSNNSVWDIFEDTNSDLWIATLGGGLDKFDRRTKKFIHVLGKRDGSTQLSYVSVITEDRSGNLWVGTAGGIEVIDLHTGQVTYYNHISGDPNSLSNDNINTIFQDSRGWIWVGTREGLDYFDAATKKFHSLYIQDGLPDNTILTLLEDNEHRLWLGTPNGLSCMTATIGPHGNKFSFFNYNESDGLQGREFNDKSALKTKDGYLIFGGANGFNLFDPSQIIINKYVPPIVFTDLQIFNKSISIGEKIKKHIILTRSITETKSITLPYGANDFSIVFAALGYDHPDNNQAGNGQGRYAYKLDGFNTGWIYSNGNTHKATYTNLDPGKYVFRVKASNNDGIRGNQEATIQVIVLPPFWKTIWAYIIYALVVIGMLYIARNILLYRARMNFQIEHQQHEAQRMHELDMMKIRFFTNISHEFRTPLTLILTPLERMLNQTEDGNLKKQLQLIHRNARRLLHLVNQLLDFRKLEVQEIKLTPVKGDMIRFIKEIVYSFTDVADKKNIHFTLETFLETLVTHFDSDKLERILFNLLSNAFKFTPENGTITVSLDIFSPLIGGDQGGTFLRIKVEDTGIGIPPEKQEKIFERFFQHDMPPAVVNPGSGIGLAITKEFVRLHQGTISVESEPGKGSCFTILLPVETSATGAGLKEEKKEAVSVPLTAGIRQEPTLKTHRKKYTLLLIEDNEDFRFYLKDNLSVYFNVTEASDGKSGWETALSQKPDLIVSDIMMPEMNGIDLSKRLKNDSRTAQIPVILLTARGSEEQRIEGYRAGVNDYIVKPFNFEILLARIRNLLAEKKHQHKAEAPKVNISPSETQFPSLDEKFIEDAKAIVEKNISNPDFSVEELSRSLYVSRVTLYKKMVSITGKTPVEFIRIVRLKRAAGLLERGMNVSQAAYETGFNNPKYFTKYFKEAFAMLPSEYVKEKKGNEQGFDTNSSDHF
jgi:signal transduction histidine kinase/ligand-binding sensor domain-containing protein/DNA-binding response OmpR family regulator